MKNNTKKKNNEMNYLILAIVTVLSIIALVGGSTFAYYQWVSADSAKTNVIFTLDTEDVMKTKLYANLEGSGTTTVTSLKPAACTHSTHALKKTVTIKYKNATTQKATITATLKVTAFSIRSTSYIPSSANLGYLKYALTTSSTNCTTGVVQSGDFNDSGKTPTLTSSSVSASNVPITLFNQTFDVVANMTSEGTQTYYLWIWLDSGYTHTNTGSTNSDPMQSLSLTAQWSGNITQSA